MRCPRASLLRGTAWALLLAPALALGACQRRPAAGAPRAPGSPDGAEEAVMEKVVRTDEEWRRLLTPEQYRVTRRAGTEPPRSGAYWRTTTPGTYHCVCCDLPLFRSDAKFDSACGWPSFFEPLEGFHVTEHTDTSHGMVRTEVRCRRCDAHLGHVFDDGPPPTDLRYCINSAAIRLEPDAGPASPPADRSPPR